jgi:hypothetical protein
VDDPNQNRVEDSFWGNLFSAGCLLAAFKIAIFGAISLIFGMIMTILPKLGLIFLVGCLLIGIVVYLIELVTKR